MFKITLERDETTPLVINGEPIGAGSTRTVGTVTNLRWTECALYKTDTGYAAQVVGRTNCADEIDRFWSTQATSPAQLARAIEEHFGKIHLAVKLAFEDAKIWDQTAEGDNFKVEKHVFNHDDSRVATFTAHGYIRLHQDHANVGKGLSPQTRITVDIDKTLNVDESELFTMALMEAVTLAREWDKAPLPF